MRPSTACTILAPFGVLLLTSLGCRQTKGCAPNSVLVSLSFSGAAANADTLALTTCIDGDAVPSGCKEGTVPHIPGSTTGSALLTFTSYMPGTSLTLTVTPMNGPSPLAPPASQSRMLDPGCNMWAFRVGSNAPGGTGGPGGLGAGSDVGGSGGKGGNAGTESLGGASGTGGGFASGGALGSGGAAATGGVVSSGGQVGTGGVVGSGGQAGTGGTGACVADPMCKTAGTSCATSTTLSTCAAEGNCLYQAAGSPSACGDGTVCERLAPASCADPNWAEWPVPPSTSPSAYTDNGDGTVTDNVKGLMWQSPSAATTMTQPAAVTYCATMLTTGGHHDWRLPTKSELLSIVDYGRSFPSINPVFTSTASSFYWSSTLQAGNELYFAWNVYFTDGATYTYKLALANNVRCVR